MFQEILIPEYTTWYALFARNRIVVAYTPRSRGASELSSATWREVHTRPGIETGRADPNTDPSGYRTLLVFQLSERYHNDPGLAERLLAAAPTRHVRAREAEQVALLETHELDYIWTYENLARSHNRQYLNLPDAIDLGNPTDSSRYAFASTLVVGRRMGDTLLVRGAPILFAVSVMQTADHPARAKQFVRFLLSPDGHRILRTHHFDALSPPILVGTGAPSF